MQVFCCIINILEKRGFEHRSRKINAQKKDKTRRRRTSKLQQVAMEFALKRSGQAGGVKEDKRSESDNHEAPHRKDDKETNTVIEVNNIHQLFAFQLIHICVCIHISVRACVCLSSKILMGRVSDLV